MVVLVKFEADKYYTTDAPELEFLGKPSTLAQWRHRGEGPPYIRFGNRVLYKGSDLNEWVESMRVIPTANNAKQAG